MTTPPESSRRQCLICGDAAGPDHECDRDRLRDALAHARGRLDVLAHTTRALLGHFTEAGEATAVVSPTLIKRARSALTARRTRPYYPDVTGHCPCCGHAALFLGEGGYVTCSSLLCAAPDAASTLLERHAAEPSVPGPLAPPRQTAGVHVTADADQLLQRTTGDTVPPAGDTTGDTSPATGGVARTHVWTDGPGSDLASGVPRPRPGDTGGDGDGDTGGDGVRFAYRATVRRGEVRHAIAEAFDLLGTELAQQREETDRRDA
ncbi:hypothetical protein [Streptomyces alfalfae]